jgi:organic hydroperoxide reductase OsmC/OhrA
VEGLRELLPIQDSLQHVRWSGYATWINLEGTGLADVPRENHTIYPSRGDVLLYPGFKNDKELLIACGSTCFKSPAGEQAGNHIATLDASPETLQDIEEATLTEGEFDVKVRITE